MKLPTRLIFCGQGKLGDLLKTLQYDSNLRPKFDHTYIIYGPHKLPFDFNPVLTEVEHNPDEFTIVNDTVLFNHYNLLERNIDLYKFGGWITQQLVKLLALDYFNHDRMLIQDCDTFVLKSNTYEYFKDSKPVLYKHQSKFVSDYCRYVKLFTGIEYTSTDPCYVSEFMPVTNAIWNDLKSKIESIHNKWWFDALYDQFDSDANVNPGSQIWFSEYELLGHWIVENYEHDTVVQRRLDILNNDHLFNCGCM